MAVSPVDNVVIQAFGVPGVPGQKADFNFGNFTSFELMNSITEPSEASFEIGDDTGWQTLNEFIGLGAEFMVIVDDRVRLQGKVYQLDQPQDAAQGVTQRFVVRTVMSDAMYNTAPQGLNLRNVSIRELILALYESIGLNEFNFDFRGDVSRDLMTGKTTRGRKSAVALDPITIEQAKINPPETIFDAADRHLRRHGLLHWDGGNGKIIVAAPDDQQEPIATFRSFRGREGQFNNTMSIMRSQDVSSAPTVLGMMGRGGKRGFNRAKVSSILIDENLIQRGFNRTIVINDESIRTRAYANRRASREFSLRRRDLDRLDIMVDGLSYREGAELLPWTPDTTHDVIAEAHGGFLGKYYLESTAMTRNAGDGDMTQLSLVRQNTWVL